MNRLGIQRRPTKRGCWAGPPVRQRYRPYDNINTTETETETDLPLTTTPIPVIFPSRRRTSRSAARRLRPSTLLPFLGLHYDSVCGVEQFAARHLHCINTVYFQKSAQDSLVFAFITIINLISRVFML